VQFFLEVLVQQSVPVAFPGPGNKGGLVETDAESGGGGGEEQAGGVLAGPVVGPGLAALDDSVADRIKDFECTDNGAGSKYFNLSPAIHTISTT
jgi:hypothetical protein